MAGNAPATTTEGPTCRISKISMPTSFGARLVSGTPMPCWTCGTPRERRRRRHPGHAEAQPFADAKSVAIRLSPPPEGGGETLFQPVGKALLEATKRGWIDRLQTLPAQDGLGFSRGLSGKPASP